MCYKPFYLHTLSRLSSSQTHTHTHTHTHKHTHTHTHTHTSTVHKARIHSRSESASHLMGGGGGGANSRSTSTSSVGNMGAVHDPSLKKLTKDLHRCEVSIARYQTMLNEVGAPLVCLV